jgi:predicted dehydrogenase
LILTAALQVNHISALNNLSDYFLTTYLCDASPSALSHVAPKVAGPLPKTTSDPEELIASPDVDVVLLCNATAFHPSHAILALKYNKYVLVEKPLALNYRDLDSITGAETQSKGKVFVGYQRRYAEAFLDAVSEVGGLGKIQYARVRDIIGPNSAFVLQSGTFPKKFTDFKKQDSEEMMAKYEEAENWALVHDCRVEVTPVSKEIFGLLGR